MRPLGYILIHDFELLVPRGRWLWDLPTPIPGQDSRNL